MMKWVYSYKTKFEFFYVTKFGGYPITTPSGNLWSKNWNMKAGHINIFHPVVYEELCNDPETLKVWGRTEFLRTRNRICKDHKFSQAVLRFSSEGMREDLENPNAEVNISPKNLYFFTDPKNGNFSTHSSNISAGTKKTCVFMHNWIRNSLNLHCITYSAPQVLTAAV